MQVSADLARLVSSHALLTSVMARLLYDPGPWVMRTRRLFTQPTIEVRGETIIVTGRFTEPIDGDEVAVFCNGEPVQVLKVDPGTDVVEWMLTPVVTTAA